MTDSSERDVGSGPRLVLSVEELAKMAHALAHL